MKILRKLILILLCLHPLGAPAERKSGITPEPPAIATRAEESVGPLLARAHDQLRARDFSGALTTCAEIEALEPDNVAVKRLRIEVGHAQRLAGELNRPAARQHMLHEVGQGWQRPQVFDKRPEEPAAEPGSGLREVLETMVIPRATFDGVPLSRVVDTLSALSEEYGPAGPGINVVLIDPNGKDPEVTISLRDLPMLRVLDFVTESVGYEYELQSDAVVVRQGLGPVSRLETEFFPVSRSTIIRLTGVGGQKAVDRGTRQSHPFAPVSSEPDAIDRGEEEALKQFLQRAGIPFATVEGANLALADGQLIVTQTSRNMEKVRNILRRYTEIKQVEIEARFLEVRQGDLEELGFDWTVQAGGRARFDPGSGNPVIGPDGRQARIYNQTYTSPNRSLAEAFGSRRVDGELAIQSPDSVDETGRVRPGLDVALPVLAPALPATIDLGEGASRLASISGVIGSADIGLIIRALERRTGNDLMSAPKVTVLSGKTAEITVAQELRYPERYGDIDAQVGRGDSSGSGSAGVAITAGTPQDFVVRNVGVEMEVTPNVEEDNAISLLLEPRVTEFDGFVEYGGTSVAIASNTTVTVPSGFFQPIFSVRRVRTEVTIWDGATVVMGGLTREHAVSVTDKIPVLGDIPLLGRFFRSEAESSEKRNLLIFVTANLISPGGSPQRQQLDGVDPGTLFQNPFLITPGGGVPRGTGASGE